LSTARSQRLVEHGHLLPRSDRIDLHHLQLWGHFILVRNQSRAHPEKIIRHYSDLIFFEVIDRAGNAKINMTILDKGSRLVFIQKERRPLCSVPVLPGECSLSGECCQVQITLSRWSFARWSRDIDRQVDLRGSKVVEG